MLQLFGSGLVALWMNMAGVKTTEIDTTQLAAWRGVPLFSLSMATDPVAENTMRQYLKGWSAKGMGEAAQGVWIQSGSMPLATHQGNIPLPAASLTKIATSAAALETWGPGHQFETSIGTTGPVRNGILQGDLVINGSGDPFFVWEEAIALGNALNKRGIRRINGNLVIVGDFYMNYQSHPYMAGQMLKQAFNPTSWPRDAQYLYNLMPPGTPKPQIAIAGSVKVSSIAIPKQILLLRHRSMSLAQILKEMNIYSNNDMAEMLAKALGGASAVAQLGATSAGVPQQEVQLVNGSGLGVENRISPRAVCGMLTAIESYLQPHQLTVADLFPISGRDRRGTMVSRHIPTGTIIKTGTLRDVSALAGVMPTRDRGLVCFAIINRGGDVDGFRKQQDQILQKLVQRWGVPPTLPAAILPSTGRADIAGFLGDASRNEILSDFQARR